MNREHFDIAFLPRTQRGLSLVQAIREKIHAWVTSPYLIDLTKMFDADINFGQELRDLLSDLEQFSARWDFRRMARERGVPTDDKMREGIGAARWLTSSPRFSEDENACVRQNVSRLGLVEGKSPSQLSYDYVIAMGGGRLSCKLRPLRIREFMDAGLGAGTVVLLGAARPILEDERDATDTYAPGAVNEFDLIVAGGQQAFGFDASQFKENRFDHPTNVNLSWVVRRFDANWRGQALSIFALSAPSSDPGRRRANSADTLEFFLGQEHVGEDSTLLLVTSQIYVPYVQLEALRTLGIPRGLFVETVGFPMNRMPALQGMSDTSHYLQEIRSAIQAARRFCEVYPS